MRLQDLAGWADSFRDGAPRVAVFEVDDDEDDLAGRTLTLAGSTSERAPSHGDRREPGHRGVAAVRGARRWVLGALLRLPAGEMQFRQSKDGRPGVAGARSPTCLEFSSSSCGAKGVFAVAVDCQVGVDLEVVDSNRFPDSIARAVLHPQELKAFDALPCADRAAWLTAAWVCKEALLKGIGLGLGIDPRGIELICSDRSASACEVAFRATGWAPWGGWLRKRGTLLTAVACTNPTARTQVIRLTP